MTWDVFSNEVKAAIETLAGPAGLVLVALLVVLLAGHAVVREIGSARVQRSLLVLDVVIVPLLALFAVVVIVRFVHMG